MSFQWWSKFITYILNNLSSSLCSRSNAVNVHLVLFGVILLFVCCFVCVCVFWFFHLLFVRLLSCHVKYTPTAINWYWLLNVRLWWWALSSWTIDWATITINKLCCAIAVDVIWLGRAILRQCYWWCDGYECSLSLGCKRKIGQHIE